MKFFLVTALVTTFIVTSEGYKCDPDILAKIKTLHAEHEIKDLIKAAIGNGKEVVVGTTAGYYPSDTECLFSTFSEDSFTSVRETEDGWPVVSVKPVKEESGFLIEPQTQIKRFHVFSEGGVTAFYKCSDNGREGDPEGIIKTPESTKDRSELVKKAKKVLEDLGIKITVRYPSACP